VARRKKSGRDVHGLLLLDKPAGISSNKALQDVRLLYRASKAGHTGSLDPLATGLLPVCFGEATKVSAFMLEQDKRYRVVVKLGVITDSGDAEGQTVSVHPVPVLHEQDITSCLAGFTGAIQQVPPMYSALKHQGKRLYELAREGRVVERKARLVTIHELRCLGFAKDCLTLDVRCSKGTYIRTLAEDIGKALGCGATVMQLRRLEVGSFAIDQAWSIEQLRQIETPAELLEKLLPVDAALLHWPKVDLNQEQAGFIKQGGQVLLQTCESGQVRMYCNDCFIGIGEVSGNGKLQPKRLFNV